MVYQISRIRRQTVLLFCAATVVMTAVLLSITPVFSDLAPKTARVAELSYLIAAPLLLIGVTLGLYSYLRPISDLGYALEIGSTPAPELAMSARKIALNAPLYFFILPTGGAFLLTALWHLAGALWQSEYTLARASSSTLLITATAACGSVVISLISRRLMRPVLLYPAARLPAGGYRLNIRARLLVTVLILTLTAVLFTGLFGYNQVVKANREQIADTALLHLSKEIALLPPTLSQEQILAEIAKGLDGAFDHEWLLLVDQSGQILSQRPADDADERIVRDPSVPGFDGELWRQEHPNKLWQPEGDSVLLPYREWWVGVSYTARSHRSASAVRTALAVVISGVAMLAMATVVSYYLADDIVFGLHDVTTRLLNIAHGERVDLGSPVPVLSIDEVGDLVHAHNALQQRMRIQQEQIEYRQRQLLVMQSLSYKIGTTQNVTHLLQEVIRDVERAFGYRNVSILLMDDARQELYFAAVGHLDASVRDRKFKIGEEGVVGHVAATGVPLLINDVANCDFYISDRTNTRSEMAVPLTIGDKIIGVFNVSSERTGAFDESDLQSVTSLANQVAIAIENARLFSEVMANAQESERQARHLMVLHDLSTALSTSIKMEEVLSIAAETLVSLLDIDHSTAILFGPADEIGLIVAEHPAKGIAGQNVPIKSFPALGRILTTRSPLFVADPRHSALMGTFRENVKTLGIQSMLLVPLLTKGHIMGVISLDSTDSQRSFASEELELCRTITAQVAVAAENVRLIRDLSSQADLLAHTARDVAAERHKLDAVLRNLADGLLVTDPTGRITLFNPAFLSLFGLEHDGLVGQFAAEVVPGAPLQNVIARTRDDRAANVQEFSLVDGRFLQVTAAAVREADRARSIVMILRDITREKQLDRMKSNFISTVSHELRTPLTPILGYAKLIRKSLGKHVTSAIPADRRLIQQTVKRMENDLDILVNEVERLRQLVEDVLFVADLDAGRLEWEMDTVDLSAILRHQVDACRAEAEIKGLSVGLELSAALPHVSGDPKRLERMIGNLLANAIKFTESGDIRVRAQAVSRHKGRWVPPPFLPVPEGLAQNEYVLVAISDTGPGIAVERQRTLFERFGQGMRDLLTDKPAGSGLGLAISKEIVSHHEGRIWAETEPGQGSTFAFVIPCPGLHI